MIQYLNPKKKSPFRVLCLGAHCDDIEIGCGGTILRILREATGPVNVRWVVFSSDGTREKEARGSARAFLEGAKKKDVIVKKFRNGFFPYVAVEIKEYFEELKKSEEPDLIFTHYRGDLHQDHRLISELTWNTFRNHLILEYEIPKYDGDLSSPNLFVGLGNESCEKKVGIILRWFGSQAGKHWFSKDTFFSLLRIRGMESASSGKYAEGFFCRKLVIP